MVTTMYAKSTKPIVIPIRLGFALYFFTIADMMFRALGTFLSGDNVCCCDSISVHVFWHQIT
jgi:hypothetical protein